LADKNCVSLKMERFLSYGHFGGHLGQSATVAAGQQSQGIFSGGSVRAGGDQQSATNNRGNNDGTYVGGGTNEGGSNNSANSTRRRNEVQNNGVVANTVGATPQSMRIPTVGWQK
jgi:hypothetical protein